LKPVYMVTPEDAIRASVASLFELPIDAVPDFTRDDHLGYLYDMPRWELHLAEWLRGHDLDLCVITISRAADQWPGEFLQFEHIRVIKTPGGYQAGVFVGDRLAHDPGNGHPLMLGHYPQFLLFTQRS
jgi:hypothetical protein